MRVSFGWHRVAVGTYGDVLDGGTNIAQRQAIGGVDVREALGVVLGKDVVDASASKELVGRVLGSATIDRIAKVGRESRDQLQQQGALALLRVVHRIAVRQEFVLCLRRELVDPGAQLRKAVSNVVHQNLPTRTHAINQQQQGGVSAFGVQSCGSSTTHLVEQSREKRRSQSIGDRAINRTRRKELCLLLESVSDRELVVDVLLASVDDSDVATSRVSANTHALSHSLSYTLLLAWHTRGGEE